MKISYGTASTAKLEEMELVWAEAFHDEPQYYQHFFQKYTPSQMFVAWHEEKVVGICYYFATELHRKGKCYSFAYLYGVATQPDLNGRGIASGLLAYAYEILAERGFDGVTTVPATPSLHDFFGRNGFVDYFVYEEKKPQRFVAGGEKLTAEEYGRRREAILSAQALAYISLGADGYAYQQGICEIYGGGFYAQGESIYCGEVSGGAVFLKEVFGTVAEDFGKKTESFRCIPRETGGDLVHSGVNFGMIQWFSPMPADWTAEERGYLGLAFD